MFNLRKVLLVKYRDGVFTIQPQYYNQVIQESQYKMQILPEMLTMTHSATLEKSCYCVSGALRKI